MKDKIWNWLKNYQNQILLIILLFAFIIRLKYFNINSAIWWDEGDYLSYARRLAFDIPTKDLWYYRRVFFMPLVWAFLYKLGFQELGLRIVQLLFSFTGVIGAYLLTKEMFDKKTALITSLLMSAYWVHLFFTARLLTDVPAVTLATFGLYFFWKGYIKKEKQSNIILAGIFLGLALFTKLSTLFYMIPIGLLILTKEKLKFIKNKNLWIIGIIIFIIMLPFVITVFNYYPENPITSFIGHYTGIKVLPGSEDVTPRTFTQVIQQFKDLTYHLKYPLLILLLLSLTYFIDLILGADLIFKEQGLQKRFFILASIVIPTAIFGYIRFYIEQRDLMLVMIFIFMLISVTTLKLYELIKQKNKTLAIVSLIVILIIAIYPQVIFADNLINEKKDSYLQVKEASEWLKQNSNPNDLIITYSTVQTTYYTDLNVTSISSEEEILTLKPRYFIISLYEQHRDWYLQYPFKHQDIMIPVQAYYLNNDQPSLVIFEVKNVPNN